MEEKPRYGCLFVGVGMVLVIFGVLGGVLLARGSLSRPPMAGQEGAIAPLSATPASPPRAMGTPKPTFTPPPTPTADSTLTVVAATVAVTPTAPAPTPIPVLFRVVAESLYFYEGPGTAYRTVALSKRDSLFPVLGRTPNGMWWQVCCMLNQPVWMELDGSTVLEQGDVGTVAILEVPILDAPPTPTFPALSLAPGGAPPPATVAPATATPRPLSDAACAIAGATYHTIPILGAPSNRAADSDPELNLNLRSYAPYAGGFLQLVGLGGETDVHAPQLNTLFEDERLNNDLPGVYRVHRWDWNCNCRSSPIDEPEVTLIGISSRPGEVLRVPSRSNGDIGGGFQAMVLYASPTQITLKYTREDNILFGYAIHIEGICLDPNLLTLYYQMEREGRKQLPALYGKQPIGYAIGGDVKVAVRDTGQFMDPRSKKDWWAAMP